MRVFTTAVLILGLGISARALDVPIIVEEPISVERTGEVVSGGISCPHFRNGALDVTYRNMAKNVAGEPAPQARGGKEKIALTLPTGKKLYIAVRTFGDSHNRSVISNVVEVEAR